MATACGGLAAADPAAPGMPLRDVSQWAADALGYFASTAQCGEIAGVVARDAARTDSLELTKHGHFDREVGEFRRGHGWEARILERGVRGAAGNLAAEACVALQRTKAAAELAATLDRHEDP